MAPADPNSDEPVCCFTHISQHPWLDGVGGGSALARPPRLLLHSSIIFVMLGYCLLSSPVWYSRAGDVEAAELSTAASLPPSRTVVSDDPDDPRSGWLLDGRAALLSALHRIELEWDGSTRAGWRKAATNPTLGGRLGTVFDAAVVREGGRYRMWFSWRPHASIALAESADGVHWSEPIVVLGPRHSSGWEDEVSRPVVVIKPDGYHMWYTGQASGRSWIGYATSRDGLEWRRASVRPVLSPDRPWEKVAVMCPHVLYDEEDGLYRMWYSGGEQYEPDAIGYAESRNGLTWKKRARPVFASNPRGGWDGRKVAGSQVIRHDGWYVMFYIGFENVDTARIGLARSKDGISDWQRLPLNPIVGPSEKASAWDHDAVYKPTAVLDGRRWLLWYNGRRGGVEQIGLAVHDGVDLGFD